MSAITAAEQSPSNEVSAPQRRMMVRVRRKRPAHVITHATPLDITRVDTNILPQIAIRNPGDTGPLVAPGSPLSLIAVDGTRIHDLREASDVKPDPAPDPVAEAAVAEAPVESPTPTLNTSEADATPDYTAALQAPDIAANEAPAPTTPDLTAEPTTLLAPDEPEPDAVAVTDEPERSAPARRMPTLAVMAALTQRSEPAPSPTTAEGEAAKAVTPDVSSSGALNTRAARPTAPLTDADRLSDALDTPGATSAESIAPIGEPAQSAEPEGVEESAAQASATSAAEAPKQATPAASVGHWMWWRQAAQRRAAPQTRAVGAVSAALDDDDLDITAPRPASRRTVSLAGQRAPRSETPRAETASVADDPPDADEALARRSRALSERRRTGMARSPRAVALSWAAAGHAAVASVAALIAVIAALRSSAGPDAWAVFGWALALALIAGVGAAVGYTFAQAGRPHPATFALLLSQVGALMWALGLLGPRAALLALAPASAALALRGAGRLSAVATTLAWMFLFIVDEALTLTGALPPTLPLDGAAAALVDVAVPLIGLWLAVSILISLYSSRMWVAARGRAVEHAALLTEEQLDRLRTQTEDDAEALRRALVEALRGEQPERVYARGALSVVADTVNDIADRLVDLRYDRAERKRLESATRRLTRVIERAWMGLSWSWPDATGTILDDLLALLRTPPPEGGDPLDETTATGQVVAPHLFRGWRPTEPLPQAQRTPPTTPSAPSEPSLPSLWPSDPGAGLTGPLDLPPSPRWRSPDALYDAFDRVNPTER